MKYFAIIQRTDIHPPTLHFYGLPSSLAFDGSNPEPLAWPRVAIITIDPEGVFLDRFSEDGSSGGDTWHESIEDAQAQALSEYNGALLPWAEIPSELDDEAAINYALSKAREA